MKKISFVQANFQQGPSNLESFYLPYSIGCLWAYATTSAYVSQNWQLDHVVWSRKPIDNVAQLLKDQDVVGLSCYVWNRRYNFALARRIKRLNPGCFIFIGGPEPAHADPEFFVKHPYIDAIVLQEGEITVQLLLERLHDPLSVPGMMVNHQGASVNTGEAARIDDLSTLPSPYLTGFFTDILANSPEVHEWAATLETNRGCPYQCTFCDWGSLTYSKVRHFPLEKVLAELQWMADNRIHMVSFADANFGMFVERDNLIIDKYLELQNTLGFPQRQTVSYAKNQRKDVLDIAEKLITKSSQYNQGLQISMQTLDEDVLSVIKRKNLQQHKAEEILLEGAKRGLVIGTELIMGLPEDTLDRWKNNYWKLLNLGMHENIDFFLAQLLENSEMNQVQKKIYNFQTANVHDYLAPVSYLNEPDEYQEYIEVIVGHDHMPHEDWAKAYTFSWFMVTLHQGGYAEYYSRFMKNHAGVAYNRFYSELYDFLSQDTWFASEIQRLNDWLHYWISKGKVDRSLYGVRISGWNLPYITLIELHQHPDLKQHLYTLLAEFVERFQLDAHLEHDLTRLQQSRVIDMRQRQHYPRQAQFDFNLHDVIVLAKPLEATSSILEFRFPERADMPDEEFLSRIYFSRRRRFGKTWVSDVSATAAPNPDLARTDTTVMHFNLVD